MGFWEMVGFALFHAVKEMKEEEEQDKLSIKLHLKLVDAEERFTAFKDAAGFTNAFYCVDWDSVDLGASFVNAEIRKMEELKPQMRLYTALGGKPELVDDLNDIDDFIDKVKYLEVVGYLDRQEEFMVFDYDDMVNFVQTDIELKRIE